MRPELAIVLAGGGERAVAWELGVLAGLADAGLDPTGADLVVGTSAGALVGAYVAAGEAPVEAAAALTYAQAAAGAAPPAGPDANVEPTTDAQEAFGAAVGAWLGSAGLGFEEQRRRVGAVAGATGADDEPHVAATAQRLTGVSWSEALTLVAVCADSGDRVALRAADGVPLERAVAASRAIPGLRPVVHCGGRRLMDGAVGSATNADLARSARRVVVVTPTPPDPAEHTLFSLWEAALAQELAMLDDVVLIQAGPEDQEAMGADMLSGARASEAFEVGRRSGAAALRPARGPAA